MSKYKIGDLVSVEAGTRLWSIQLQANVSFDKVTIYKITHRNAFTKEPCFGKRCEILFNAPGCIPGLMETIQEFGIHPSIIKPYTIPTYQALEPVGYR